MRVPGTGSPKMDLISSGISTMRGISGGMPPEKRFSDALSTFLVPFRQLSGWGGLDSYGSGVNLNEYAGR